MKILVACEESQAVTIQLRKLGHEAYSCDVQPCSGGHPEWHIKGDVTKILTPCERDISELLGGNIVETLQNGEKVILPSRWDMIIAHPPCTYLSNAGARHLYKGGQLQQDRYKRGLKAKELFMAIYKADCPRIAIENPIQSKIYDLPSFTQYIQPYEFGHPYKKRTRLWLKGLPKLMPTKIVEVECSTRLAGNWFNKGGVERQKNRSKTFSGIAKAMAEQWTAACL